MILSPVQRPNALPDAEEIRRVFVFGLSLAAATGMLFTLAPGLDLAVSALFQRTDGVFALSESTLFKTLRTLFLRGFAVWYIVIAVAVIRAGVTRLPVLGLSGPKWFYLLLCSLLGPLLLVNLFLKEEWGRWRPHEVGEFGGDQLFTTPLDPGGSCYDNCSFVSGEVSSMVMAFLALALVSSRWRPLLYLLAAVMGFLSALIRVGQGGHFLSDTLFAAAFMILIAAAVYCVLFLGHRPLAMANELDWRRVASWHDRLFAVVCNAGLKTLDRIAPRR
jgi:lipid A 4'-phosphatase